MQRRPTLTLLAALAASAPALALTAGGPYDETANAATDVQRALAQASGNGRPVLVIFGANWCGDCKALDLAMKSPANASLIADEFVVVKVDVGKFNKHLDVAERAGVTLKKGIPAAAVLSPRGETLYATQAGELADARRMSDTGVYDFFRGVVASAKAAPAKR